MSRDARRSSDVAREALTARAWRVNLRWTAVLLLLWFACTFGVSWFARELRFDFFGWPFSFWAGAQGLLILYVVMAALYAWRMNRAYALTEAPEADERLANPSVYPDADIPNRPESVRTP